MTCKVALAAYKMSEFIQNRCVSQVEELLGNVFCKAIKEIYCDCHEREPLPYTTVKFKVRLG